MTVYTFALLIYGTYWWWCVMDLYLLRKISNLSIYMYLRLVLMNSTFYMLINIYESKNMLIYDNMGLNECYNLWVGFMNWLKWVLSESINICICWCRW